MALSPNYGWAEPDNSSLVKNGAQDIRALGDAIDTSLWNVGYGQAGKNKLINADYTINQRSFTTASTTNVYTFDRWLTLVGGDGTTTFTPQTFTPGTAPVTGYEATNFLRIVTASQTTTAVASAIRQRIENVRNFAGQTATISFWAKAATGTPKVGVGIQQVFGSGGSPSSALYATPPTPVTISTSWARYSVTIAIPSISGKTIGTDANTSNVAVVLAVSAGSDNTANFGAVGIQSNTFDIWGVQAEYGSKMTPFQTATGTIQGELAACQRYAWNPLFNNTNANSPVAPAYADSTSSARIVQKFPVTMRIVPSYSFQTVTNWSLGYPGGFALTSTTAELNTTEQCQFVVGVAAASLTINKTYQLYRPGTTDLLLFSAEL